MYGVVDGAPGRLWLATLTEGAWTTAVCFDAQCRTYLRHPDCSFLFEFEDAKDATLFKTFWG
jgi:hypothetical protein